MKPRYTPLELLLVVEVRVETEERYEEARMVLVGLPDHVVRPGVVVARVRVVQGKDYAPRDPYGQHPLAHPFRSHRPAVHIHPDVGVGVEDATPCGSLSRTHAQTPAIAPLVRVSMPCFLSVSVKDASADLVRDHDREMLAGGSGGCRARPAQAQPLNLNSSKVQARL